MNAPSLPRVAAIAADRVCGRARFLVPLRAMIGRRAVLGNYLPAPSVRINVGPGWTILTQRHVSFDTGLTTSARQHGCRFFHDVDELIWSLPADHPDATTFTPAVLATADAHMRACDAVSVPSEALASALASRGCAAVVLPTVIDRRDWSAQPPRAARERPRVGWYGRPGVHAADLALLSDVVRALINDVDFVFFGDRPAGLDDVAPRIECHRPVASEFFPALLAALDLDLVLAPLANTPFNECASNARLLHAGMLAYPVVASDVFPHRGLPVTLVGDAAAAWIAAIRERVAEPAATRAEGERLRRAVHERFLVEDWLERYVASWTGRAARVPACA